MLQWKRIPERQQRTQEEPAPCELGLSALHGQETAALTHVERHRQTRTHTQHYTLEQLLPQQSPLCSFNSDGLPGPPTTRVEERDRRTKSDTTDKHPYCRRPAVTDTILMAPQYENTQSYRAKNKNGFHMRKWMLYYKYMSFILP